MSLLPPNSELVACAWLAAVPGFSSAMIGTTLPNLPSKGTVPAWVATGFLKVLVVGGSPHAFVPQAQPVVGITCYAVNVTQVGANGPINVATKPPWDRAALLGEQIRQAAYPLNKSAAGRVLSMPVPGYARAAVQSAVVLTEPRRVPSDFASYAQYTLDVQLSWVAEAT